MCFRTRCSRRSVKKLIWATLRPLSQLGRSLVVVDVAFDILRIVLDLASNLGRQMPLQVKKGGLSVVG